MSFLTVDRQVTADNTDEKEDAKESDDLEVSAVQISNKNNVSIYNYLGRYSTLQTQYTV